MAYGIKIWNSNGDVQIDLSTRITRVLDWFTVTRSNSGSKYYANYFKTTHGLFALASQIETPNNITTQHSVSFSSSGSGSTVSWEPAKDSNGNQSSYTRSPSVIYVMVYK